jgi:ABC-type Mn2+/Zn2+ transport system ATPase subunit
MNKAAGSSRIVLIGGPNGAGKTTFAQEYLPMEAGLSGLHQRRYTEKSLIAGSPMTIRHGRLG